MSRSKIQNTQQLAQQQITQQQIRFLELLQLSTGEIEGRIEREIEENPVLEEEQASEAYEEMQKLLSDAKGYASSNKPLHQSNSEDDQIGQRIASTESLSEHLMKQVGFLSLPESEQRIAEQIIGSLDEDGYLRRPLLAINQDLRKRGLKTELPNVEEVLHYVQGLDPAGIAARSLQECLLIQLAQLTAHPSQGEALRIIKEQYDLFTKKRFQRIATKLQLSKEAAKEALQLIMSLDPKPGSSTEGTSSAPIYQTPDFILQKEGDLLDVQLSYTSTKRLRLSAYYTKLLSRMQKTKTIEPRNRETLRFIKSKSEAALWFIQALQQREETLLGTARIIVDKQRSFLLSGDPMQLRPLVLIDVAEQLKVDVSTISRIVNNKRIQTHFGIFSLRYFFSQGVLTQEKGEISNRAVQAYLKQLIQEEDKKKPLSDEALCRILQSNGYIIARRTIAKYRELLHIPPARLRKQW